ncbi:DinB family protein [Tamlana flava]|uniref:DinB family protein n=1 Tax=Tamlana flava TaxID=3158572 RepID=UPI00351B6F9A
MNNIISQLENNKYVFENLLKDIAEAQYLWRPAPDKWCLLEIVCHLVDEEIYDFRARVKHALEDSDKTMVPINPVGWVTEKNYISKNFVQTLHNFIEERNKSISWLKTLKQSNWESTLQHPDLGTMPAKLFLNNWLAHDYLHFRQIVRYKYEYFKQNSDTELSYAGNW